MPRDLMFWQRWATILQSSGMWRRVMWYTGTNISDEHSTSIFRIGDCIGQLYCEMWGAHSSTKMNSFWDGVPYSFVERISVPEELFASTFRAEQCYPPLTESVHEIRGFLAVSRLRQRWRRVVYEPSFRGEHVLPGRWTVRNLPKLQFTPTFQNILHHTPEECNRH